MRRIALAVAVAVAVLVPFAVAAIAAHAARRSQCQRLKGKDLAPARSVKLVRVPNPDRNGDDLVGCMLPSGTRYRIASSSDRETAGESYTVSQVNARIVLVAYRYASQYGFGVRGADGVRHEGRSCGRRDRQPRHRRDPDSRVRRRWHPQRFRCRRSERLAAYSLGLRGNLVSWKHDGRLRTADLKTAG